MHPQSEHEDSTKVRGLHCGEGKICLCSGGYVVVPFYGTCFEHAFQALTEGTLRRAIAIDFDIETKEKLMGFNPENTRHKLWLTRT
jgi:hypothetical protein